MLTHVWGLLAHPSTEWTQISKEEETVTHLYAHHVLLLAAVPVVCAYIGPGHDDVATLGLDDPRKPAGPLR